MQLARGPNGESIALTHDVCGRVVERRVERKGFRPKIWTYGWDTHDRLVRCDNPEGETWFYRYDPFGRRITKVRKLAKKELAWTAQKFSALVLVSAREATKIWTWPEPPHGAGKPGDTRPPIVGTHFTWDEDVVAEEAPLRLDGTTDWDEATRWHFEPGGFRPLAKQTTDGTLLHIANDYLGTPREMFDEGGQLRWAASYTTWGAVRGIRAMPEPVKGGRRAIYPRQDITKGNVAVKIESQDAAYDCPIRFQGQWADQDSNLLYNRHRSYDSFSGQYSSKDPIGVNGGERPHGYVICPIVSFDALGLKSTFPGSSLQGARLAMQLKAEQAAGARAPIAITRFTDHAEKQIAGRDSGRGVSRAALQDAFDNPNSIRYQPTQYGPSFVYTGNNAAVAVNPAGDVTTGWATNSAGFAR